VLFAQSKETEPEPQERTVTVSKFTGRPGVGEADIKVFEDIDWSEKRTSSNKTGNYEDACLK
jgi:hypothetical protein